MTTETEDRLRRVLHRRAEEITTAPAYRLVDEDDVLETRRPANRHVPPSWLVSVTAFAAVAAVVVAVLVSTGSGRPTPVAGRACAIARVAGFRTAMRTDRLPAGSTVLSGGADGSELVVVHGPGHPAAVRLVSPSGAVRQLWTAAPGERVRITANPSGAVGTALVAFEVRDLRTSTVTDVVVDQHGRATVLPPPPARFVLPDSPLTAPLAGDDTVTVLEQSRTRAADQHVIVYWTDFTPWRRTLAGDATRVRQLLDAGGNIVLRRQGRDRRVDLAFTEPQYRPRALGPAAADGYSFSGDGTTLTWLSGGSTSPAVLHWSPAQPAPRRYALPAGFAPQQATGELVTGRIAGTAGSVVVDPARGTVTALPIGVRLIRADGPVAVLASGSGASTAYHLVPVRVFAECRS